MSFSLVLRDTKHSLDGNSYPVLRGTTEPHMESLSDPEQIVHDVRNRVHEASGLPLNPAASSSLKDNSRKMSQQYRVYCYPEMC